MICDYCRSEIPDGSEVCPKCGMRLRPAEPQYQPVNGTLVPNMGPESAAVCDLLKNACSSKLFLAMCILATVQPVIIFATQLMSGILSIIIPAVIAVSLWTMRSAAVNNRHLLSFATPLKALDIVMAIYVVLMWIVVGAFAVSGVALLFGAKFAETSELIAAFESIVGQKISIEIINDVGFEAFFMLLGGAILAIGALVAVITIFYYGSIRKATRSTRDSVSLGRPVFKSFDTVKVWLIVMGIVNVITSATQFVGYDEKLTETANLVQNLTSGISGVSAAVLTIIAGVLLGRISVPKDCD